MARFCVWLDTLLISMFKNNGFHRLVLGASPADYVKNLQMLLSSLSTTNNTYSILHQVPEGHVGVYWRGGALLSTITDPGRHEHINS